MVGCVFQNASSSFRSHDKQVSKRNEQLTLSHITPESSRLSHSEVESIACSVRDSGQTQHDDIDENGCLKLHLGCKD